MYTPTTAVPGTSWAKLEPAIYSAESIPHIWEWLSPFIQSSLRYAQGTMTLEEFRLLLERGEATCFATVREGQPVLVLVIIPVSYATYKVARVIALAGREVKAAMQFFDALEAWALTQGCVEIEGWCRPAMVKFTRALGFKQKFAIISRDLRGRLQ